MGYDRFIASNIQFINHFISEILLELLTVTLINQKIISFYLQYRLAVTKQEMNSMSQNYL